MHMMFTGEEMRWIDTKVFGWKINPECPKEIAGKIQGKLKTIAEQKV